MPVLPPAEVRDLASVHRDWDVNVVVWLVHDAGTGHGESSGRTDAYNPAGPYRGLLQIADFNARRFGYQPEAMYDPRLNIEVAHLLWLERGFAPWPAAARYPGFVQPPQGGQVAMNFPPDETAPVQPWLKAPRPPGAEPRIIIIHATRGASSQAIQYTATKNWFNSTNNGSAAQGWGGCATVVISHEGQLCRFMDELREVPRYSAGLGSFAPPNGWSADDWGLSIELAQSAAQEAYDPRTIERCALLTATWCKRYGIDPVHRQYFDQRGASPAATGITGHDETENGRKLGKTDPGPKFPWQQFIARVQDFMGGTPAEEEIMIRHNAIAQFVDPIKLTGGEVGIPLTAFVPALPDNPSLVRIEVYATQDDRANDPEFKVLDGDGRHAGFLGWGRGGNDVMGAVDVVPQGGVFKLQGVGTVLRLGVVAYWR